MEAGKGLLLPTAQKGRYLLGIQPLLQFCWPAPGAAADEVASLAPSARPAGLPRSFHACAMSFLQYPPKHPTNTHSRALRFSFSAYFSSKLILGESSPASC